MKGSDTEFKLISDKIISLIMLKNYKLSITIIDNYKTTNLNNVISMRLFKLISLFALGDFKEMNLILDQFQKKEIMSNEILIQAKLFCLINDNRTDDYIRYSYDYSSDNSDSFAAFPVLNAGEKGNIGDNEIIEKKYVLLKNIDESGINFNFGYLNETSNLTRIYSPLIEKILKDNISYPKKEIIFLLTAQLKSNIRSEDALIFFDAAINANPKYKIAYYLRGMYYKNIKKDTVSAEKDFSFFQPLK